MRVEIFGQSYNVRGEEARAHIEELARYVDSRMKAVAESMPGSDSLKVAILAALNVADELFTLERKHVDAEKEWNQRVSELNETLSASLQDPETSLFG